MVLIVSGSVKKKSDGFLVTSSEAYFGLRPGRRCKLSTKAVIPNLGVETILGVPRYAYWVAEDC